MGEYHDLYLKGNTLLLADVFESFLKKCVRYLWTRPCKISFMASSFKN